MNKSLRNTFLYDFLGNSLVVRDVYVVLVGDTV